MGLTCKIDLLGLCWSRSDMKSSPTTLISLGMVYNFLNIFLQFSFISPFSYISMLPGVDKMINNFLQLFEGRGKTFKELIGD